MRILLVEDDIKLGKTVQQGLREERYVVDLATDGAQAAEFAIINEYDVIILDIRLPLKDGYSLCRDWREEGIKTPILMLTANDALSQKVEGLDSGADDYLTKPFEFDELLARLRALIRRNHGRVQKKLQIADLALDPVSHQVERAGEPIDLSALEYRLLQYLMENNGKVLSRMSIGEHVWDMNFDSDSNVIDVYINYLRKKVDKRFSPKLIHTVRGSGYIMKDNGDA